MADDSPTLSGYTIQSKPAQLGTRLSLMIWGPSGSGKTTLASTAPKNILWINFDPDGEQAIPSHLLHDGLVTIIDLSSEPDSVVEKFKKTNPLGLDKYLTEHEDVHTIVVDSLTTFGDKAMSHAVIVAQGTAKGRNSTLEEPGYAGYGNKNTWMRLIVKNMLAITGKHRRNIIFIAHEDKPEKDQQGVPLFITIMLGASLAQQVPVPIGEIWTLEDVKGKRRIAVRPCRLRKPMKTKIFDARKTLEFDWLYDAITDKGEGIADWLEQWEANEFKKIPIPTGKDK